MRANLREPRLVVAVAALLMLVACSSVPYTPNPYWAMYPRDFGGPN